MEATTDVWEIPPERATRVGHPAPFPVELPERLIHLYTYRGDLVLDPFVGAGSTAVAAVRTGRHYVGYDTDPAYVDRARERVRQERLRLRRAGAAPPSGAVPTVGAAGDGDADGDPVEQALRAGRAAREVARVLVEESGFRIVTVGARPAPDLEVALEARDRSGRRWLFDVAGGYTIVRPGLRRADTLWKALGKAAVLHELEPDLPFVLLTADIPNGAGSAPRLLAAVTGPGKPVLAVLALQDRRDRRRLRAFAALGPQAAGDPA
jgi:site-specific DNA-methyltransferase (adenine-specific)